MIDNQTITSADFAKIAGFIEGTYGIKMPPSKKGMVTARLLKIMRKKGFNSLSEYVAYVFSPKGQKSEMIALIDALTTNKTNFFREPSHFEILSKKILPIILQKNGLVSRDQVRIWCSACSTGEEPYTLAMVLQEFATLNRNFCPTILASDLSTKVLKEAKRGIYPAERISDIPLDLRHKYLLKSNNSTVSLVQFKPEIQKLITFRRINLMSEDFAITEKMHIIFCRNVLIYFSRKSQQALMRRFAQQLLPGGFLLIGHSESLHGMDVPFKQVMTTVYQKDDHASS